MWGEWLKEHPIVAVIAVFGCISLVHDLMKKAHWKTRERANTVSGRLAIVLSWATNGMAVAAFGLAGYLYFQQATTDANLFAGLSAVFGVLTFLLGQAILFVLAGPAKAEQDSVGG